MAVEASSQFPSQNWTTERKEGLHTVCRPVCMCHFGESVVQHTGKTSD